MCKEEFGSLVRKRGLQNIYKEVNTTLRFLESIQLSKVKLKQTLIKILEYHIK